MRIMKFRSWLLPGLMLLVLVVMPLSLRGLDAYLGTQLYRCRNGVLDPGEECDDGNRNNRDDCPNDCRLPVCGDEVVKGREECDDGNMVAGDGCGPQCTFERKCRNGVVNSGEECDDGNLNNGDGCSTGCRILSGWSCTGSPSRCRQRCGNGIVEPEFGEQCDDQGNRDGDGCSRICAVERAWACTAEDGQPSRCHCIATAAQCGLVQCGNGVLNPGEECDSGINNGKPDAPCNPNCSAKTGFTCWGRIGEKSICSRDAASVIEEQRRLVLKEWGKSLLGLD